MEEKSIIAKLVPFCNKHFLQQEFKRVRIKEMFERMQLSEQSEFQIDCQKVK